MKFVNYAESKLGEIVNSAGLQRLNIRDFQPETANRFIVLGAADFGLNPATGGPPVPVGQANITEEQLYGANVVDQIIRFPTSNQYNAVFGGTYITGVNTLDLLTYNQNQTSAIASDALMRNATLGVLRLGANDHAGYTATPFSHIADANPQDAFTLTFTPPSSSDYLIYATASINCAAASTDFVARLWDQNTSTAYGSVTSNLRATTEYLPWSAMTRLSGISGAQDLRLQIHSTTQTTTMRDMCIRAIRLDDLEDYEYAESLGTDTDNVGTYLVKAQITGWTPSDGEWLLLSSAQVGRSAVTTAHSRLWDGTTTYTETQSNPIATNKDYSISHSRRLIYSGAGSTQIDLEYRTGTATRAMYIKQAVVAALKIAPDPTHILKGAINAKGAITVKGA